MEEASFNSDQDSRSSANTTGRHPAKKIISKVNVNGSSPAVVMKRYETIVWNVWIGIIW